MYGALSLGGGRLGGVWVRRGIFFLRICRRGLEGNRCLGWLP